MCSFALMFKKALSILIIVLFFTSSYNKVANWHTHIINGVLIQHAHPNSDKSQQQHSHTKSELLVINIIDGHFWDNVQQVILPSITELPIVPYVAVELFRVFLPTQSFSNKSPPNSIR